MFAAITQKLDAKHFWFESMQNSNNLVYLFTMSTNALLFTMFALRELFLFFNVLYFNILCNFHCICSICLCLWFNRKEIFRKVIWNFLLLLQRTVCSKRWTFLDAFLITSTISMLLFSKTCKYKKFDGTNLCWIRHNITDI